VPHRFNNRPAQKASRRHLRTNGTSAEAALWLRLKQRQVRGRRFRRQHSVGAYIYCPSEWLAIELDGAVHDDPARRAYDAERTRHLGAVGIRVIRFENRAVFEEPAAVLAAIAAHFSTP
jgi:very-short-patch-repair endonuclease